MPYDELGYSYYNTVVAVENSNPFSPGQIDEILWKKVNQSNFPEVQLSERHKSWKSEWAETATRNEVYQFVSVHYVFYIQNLIREGGMGGRHLVALNSKNGKVEFSTFYFDSEGTYLLPLNGAEPARMEGTSQWVGKLFEGKPPVVFGFYGNSFGCPAIDFVDLEMAPIYIKCDNRH